MAQLTIQLSDEDLRYVRRRAEERGISVDALIREHLGGPGSGDLEAQQEALRALVERASKSTSGSQGRRWTRDELHERDGDLRRYRQATLLR